MNTQEYQQSILESLNDVLVLARVKWGNLSKDANVVFEKAETLLKNSRTNGVLEDPDAATPFFPQLSPASGDASGSPAVAKCVPVGDPPTLAGVYGSTDSGGVSGEEVKP